MLPLGKIALDLSYRTADFWNIAALHNSTAPPIFAIQCRA